MLHAVTALGVLSVAVHAAPCDIYRDAGTPCVAAHSTVRALYDSFTGPLYSVNRSSDNLVHSVHVLEPGGFADSASQEFFCASAALCTIQRIFDQSPQGNHLEVAPGAPEYKPPRYYPDHGVNASRYQLAVNGTRHRVYAAYFEGQMGYRRDKTSGVATGNRPETIYMVVRGRHYNNLCCFDYGNAESTPRDDGAGTMEAVNFGNGGAPGNPFPVHHGTGDGPWVMADLEQGLFGGNATINKHNVPIDAPFVTAMLNGRENGITLKGGDANGGPLLTLYNGPRSAEYNPMKKQGAIVLGIGGDNSPKGVGTFLEGAITDGVASNDVDAAVHRNIVEAGFREVQSHGE